MAEFLRVTEASQDEDILKAHEVLQPQYMTERGTNLNGWGWD